MGNPLETMWNNFTDIGSSFLNTVNAGVQASKEALGYPVRQILGPYLASAQSINQSNIDSEREAREWEKMMSDTAIQRRVEDIKKAGLNPWLALNGGSLGEASSPSASAVRYDSSIEKQYYADRRVILQGIIRVLGGLTNSAGSVLKLLAA